MGQPAPAEALESKSPLPVVDVKTELGGVGVLGLVQDDRRIPGEVEIVELSPEGFRYTKLATKPNVNLGWDMVEGEVTGVHAVQMAGTVINEVQIIPEHETPDGEGEHVRFAMSEQIESSAGISFAAMGEYQGPAEGLIGRRVIPEQPG